MTAGVTAVWGPVDQVASPYLVLPLNVEPTKPRLCHDERYLNLWIRDLPFKLDHLCDLPRYVLPHHFQTTFDDKNGYQHVLLHSLENGGCRSSEVNGVLKDIFRSCREYNFSLDVYYVPSGGNPADLPSRSWSDADCMLAISACEQVKRLFGPHTFDLMSLDSNCQRNKVGLHLPHFTPCATPESSGINVFAYSLPLDHNIYVFPPFVLIAPLLRYLLEQDFHGAFTIVVPDLKPRRFWWALLQSLAVDHALLGRRNQASILWYPSQGGQGWYLRNLQWDLWAFRCVC